MKVIGIISARVSKTARVPDKALLPLDGKTMLEHHINRMAEAIYKPHICVATSRWPGNEVISKIAERNLVNCLSGSENDVLARHIEVCELLEADACIRIPCDSPMFAFQTISALTDKYKQSGGELDYVYISNIPFECSISPELISLKGLKKAHKYYQGAAVTLPFWEHWKDFNIAGIEADPKLVRPEYRLTVDTPQDYVGMSHLYQALYEGKPIGLEDAYAWLDNNPHIARLLGAGELSAINKRFLEAQKNANNS